MMLEKAIQNYIKFHKETDLRAYINKRENFFAPSIKDPKNGGNVFCGKETYESLSDLGDSVIKSEQWHRSVPKAKLMDEILKLFGELIFDCDFYANDTNSFKTALISKVKSKFKLYTIYIPCHISYSTETKEELEIGKVIVFNRLAFEDHIHSVKLDNDPSNDIHIEILQRGVEHYKNFGWFIGVTIDSVYDLDTAIELAESAAKNFLNLLHIIISSSHSNKMIVGFDIPTSYRHYALFKDNTEELSYKTSSSSSGNVGLPKQLFSIFNNSFPKELLDIFSECIDLSLDLKNEYPIANRILDAAFWYGDAVRESNYSVMIIKYATALERLLIFGENRGFKALISNRGIALLSVRDFIEPKEMKETQRQLQLMYKLRSEILHGEISPTSVQFEMPIYKVEECCRTIIQAFSLTVHLGLKNKNESNLLIWLKDIVKNIVHKENSVNID